MENILLALDGSSLTEVALPFASAIAARTGADLTLLHTARHRTPFRDVGVEQVRAMENGEEYLTGIASGLRKSGVGVDTHVSLGRSPAEWILEQSERPRKSLIVMATHDRAGPDRWLHGSVAEAVVHRTTVPVMLVRGTADALVAQRFLMHEPTLLVPLDGSGLGDAALPFAGELARATGARVVLVAVAPNPGQPVAGAGGAILSYDGPEQATLEAEARGHMRARASWLGRVAGLESVVRYGSPAAEIGAAAEEYAAAAVVMATHGRTGLRRSMLGSVAGGVVHGTSVPVVLIRPVASQPTDPVSGEAAAVQ